MNAKLSFICSYAETKKKKKLKTSVFQVWFCSFNQSSRLYAGHSLEVNPRAKGPLRLEESAGLCQHRVRDHTATFMESGPFYSPLALSSCRCRLGAILHRKPFEAQGEIDSSTERPSLNGLKFKLNIPEDEDSL